MAWSTAGVWVRTSLQCYSLWLKSQRKSLADLPYLETRLSIRFSLLRAQSLMGANWHIECIEPMKQKSYLILALGFYCVQQEFHHVLSRTEQEHSHNHEPAQACSFVIGLTSLMTETLTETLTEVVRASTGGKWLIEQVNSSRLSYCGASSGPD